MNKNAVAVVALAVVLTEVHRYSVAVAIGALII